MSVWKNKQRDYWSYGFQYKLKRYSGSGYQGRKNATSAENRHKKELHLATESASRDKDFELVDALPEDLDGLRNKYNLFLNDPYNTLPDLIDLVFYDLGIPYSFKDIKAIAIKRGAKKHISAKLRLLILKRDNYKCVLCGASPKETVLHIDHIVPVSRGGLTEERNLRVLCRECNQGKNDQPFYVSG